MLGTSKKSLPEMVTDYFQWDPGCMTLEMGFKRWDPHVVFHDEIMKPPISG